MFAGSLVALITPFREGRVDERKLAELVEFQVRNGTSGIVPCGSTGEAATLTDEEHDLVMRIVIETAAGRVPVVVGTGTNDTAKAIKRTVGAKRAGADGALVVTPYYNKPTETGLLMHFRAIAESADIPIILYNVPGRTGINMLPSTVAELAKVPTIVGIKESSGNIAQIAEVVKLCGPKFDVISGDDALTLPVLAVGGCGVISVVANVAPTPVAELIRSYQAGDHSHALQVHLDLIDLCNAMFLETNPIPVKTAAGLMGLCSPELRLPLSPMQAGNVEKLKQVLQTHNLLPAN